MCWWSKACLSVKARSTAKRTEYVCPCPDASVSDTDVCWQTKACRYAWAHNAAKQKAGQSACVLCKPASHLDALMQPGVLDSERSQHSKA